MNTPKPDSASAGVTQPPPTQDASARPQPPDRARGHARAYQTARAALGNCHGCVAGGVHLGAAHRPPALLPWASSASYRAVWGSRWCPLRLARWLGTRSFRRRLSTECTGDDHALAQALRTEWSESAKTPTLASICAQLRRLKPLAHSACDHRLPGRRKRPSRQ